MYYIIGALAAGYFVFLLAGVRLGNRPGAVIRMSLDGVKTAWTLMVILLVIGMLTGTWRGAGSIVTFVCYGIQMIRPRLFLLIAFLLTCLLSYALGTSFGVAGTAGVIFMTLARGGGVDPVLTAGVLLSGIYFGDRTSPASSTAFTVASVTGTDLYTNVRNMLRTGLLPWLLCLGFYAFLSCSNPISSLDPDVLRAFEENFTISAWTLLPALIILIFPLLHIPILITLCSSIAAAAVIAVVLQHAGPAEILRDALLGYHAQDPAAAAILDGGGAVSMAGTIIIVALACSYTGIMNGTGMIRLLEMRIDRIADRLGLFPCMILLCLATAAVFCNQVVAIILCENLLGPSYARRGLSREELAVDIENTAITIPALIPWCILSSVPLAIFGVSYAAVPYAVYSYAIPLVNLLAKRVKGAGKRN